MDGLPTPGLRVSWQVCLPSPIIPVMRAVGEIDLYANTKRFVERAIC